MSIFASSSLTINAQVAERFSQAGLEKHSRRSGGSRSRSTFTLKQGLTLVAVVVGFAAIGLVLKSRAAARRVSKLAVVPPRDLATADGGFWAQRSDGSVGILRIPRVFSGDIRFNDDELGLVRRYIGEPVADKFGRLGRRGKTLKGGYLAVSNTEPLLGQVRDSLLRISREWPQNHAEKPLLAKLVLKLPRPVLPPLH